MKFPKIYYVTQPIAEMSYAEQVAKVCEGGIRLIQLRLKNISNEDYIDIACEVKQVTDRYNAMLIINDNIIVSRIVGATGVHLGLSDVSLSEARQYLLPGTIVGGTANTFERIQEIYPYVNYIGLGPFRFTTTKQNLSPILGLEGYTRIMAQMRAHNMTKPIFAIGGIEQTDIPSILQTGVHGIALSSTIAKAECMATVAKKLIINYNE